MLQIKLMITLLFLIAFLIILVLAEIERKDK